MLGEPDVQRHRKKIPFSNNSQEKAAQEKIQEQPLDKYNWYIFYRLVNLNRNFNALQFHE